jgi:pyruvate formate lyase activating enzyme
MVLYTTRCNFRCPFCHNGQLVLEEDIEPLSIETIYDMLSARQGFIDGVVITGGEPTLFRELEELIAGIRRMELAVKLDTNGYLPDVLEKLLRSGTLDFVSMDIKTSWAKYDRATGIKADRARLEKSVTLIKESGIEHEFRTTCVPSLVDGDDIEQISRIVSGQGLFTLQQFQPEHTMNPEYRTVQPYPAETLLQFKDIALQYTASCRIIGIPKNQSFK